MQRSSPDPVRLIRDLRNAGLSRADIAQQAHVSPTTIWRLATAANRDHLTQTVGKFERLHQRVIGKPPGKP